MYDNSQYAYIVGRLRALSTTMMNQNFLERMVDSPKAEEAYRVLNDMPMIMGYLGDYGVQDFSKALNASMQGMKELLRQMAPYPELLDFLWYRYDFHNLKIALKMQLSQRGYAEVEHALVDLGTIPVSEWRKLLLEEKPIDLPPAFKHASLKAKEAYEKEQDPQWVDQIVDQHYLMALRGMADNIGSPMISAYLSRLVDISNLKAFIRCRELKKDQAVLEKMLLKGGYVAHSTFMDSFERGYDELRQLLEKTMHAEDLVTSLERFSEEKSLLSVEKIARELQQRFMDASKQISFGPEPVFAFYWRFKNHLQIMRTVLIGKLNRLESAVITQHTLSL